MAVPGQVPPWAELVQRSGPLLAGWRQYQARSKLGLELVFLSDPSSPGKYHKGKFESSWLTYAVLMDIGSARVYTGNGPCFRINMPFACSTHISPGDP